MNNSLDQVVVEAADDVDPQLLRRAFGSFATGVTIVTTTDADGQPVGLTANSFTSVSMDPPLVLFCLDRRSSSLQRFQSARMFGINVSSSDQQALSARFVQRGEDRFKGLDWALREPGVPVLDGAAAKRC